MSQFVFWDTERIRLFYFPQQSGRDQNARLTLLVSVEQIHPFKTEAEAKQAFLQQAKRWIYDNMGS
jgi:hypothetical protein